MSKIRWTDKVYLDSHGNIRCSTNTDIVIEDIISKFKVNESLAQPIKEAEMTEVMYRALTEEVLREFGEWIKTQPIYVGGGTTDREILVIRNGKFESAIEVYLKEKEAENE